MIRFLPHILFIAGSLFLLAGTVFFADGSRWARSEADFTRWEHS